MNENRLSENEWTDSIRKKLEKSLNKYDPKYKTKAFQKITYSHEILSYQIDGDKWIANSGEDPKEDAPFETDLIIYEENDGIIKPRVIIEAKINSISTHDAITYSQKAAMHKNVTPYLRYGIMIGNRKDSPLPGRLFKHGQNFDFMFSFKGTEPTDEEWNVFFKMIKDEITYSIDLEEMLHESRSKDRKRYYMLQKKLVLEEID